MKIVLSCDKDKKYWSVLSLEKNFAVKHRHVLCFQAKREFVEKYGSVPPRYDTMMDMRDRDFDSIIPGRKVKTMITR